VPTGTDAPTEIETVEVSEDPGATVTDEGTKVTLAPEGVPEAERETVDAKLPIGVTVRVAVPELPCWTVTEEGDTETEKSGVGPGELTTRVNVAVCGIPPGAANPVNVIENVPVAAEEPTTIVTVEVADAPGITAI
jgi:hypothetical protein